MRRVCALHKDDWWVGVRCTFLHLMGTGAVADFRLVLQASSFKYLCFISWAWTGPFVGCAAALGVPPVQILKVCIFIRLLLWSGETPNVSPLHIWEWPYQLIHRIFVFLLTLWGYPLIQRVCLFLFFFHVGISSTSSIFHRENVR